MPETPAPKKMLSTWPISLSLCLIVAMLAGCAVRKPASSYLIDGNEYFKKGEYDKAEKQYREALVSEPNNATVLNNLGVILNEQGQTDEAIKVLTQAIDQDP